MHLILPLLSFRTRFMTDSFQNLFLEGHRGVRAFVLLRKTQNDQKQKFKQVDSEGIESSDNSTSNGYQGTRASVPFSIGTFSPSESWSS